VTRLISAWILSLLSAAAVAQTVRVDANAEVAAVLFAASATQAALAKNFDVRLKEKQQRIDALAAELKAGDNRHRAEMVAAQDAFVAELASKDREYAVQIAAFRSTVNDIASTPEGAQALERFNAGDEVGALAILDRLRAGNEKMRAERMRLEDAAEARRIARLAWEARLRGKVTLDTVITRFEEVVKLDPGVADDWIELERMYTEIGKLPEARKAVDSLAAAARNDRERGAALREKADVLMQQGDLVGARKAAEDAVALLRKVSTDDSGNRAAEVGYSRALQQFGEVAKLQGDLTSAENAYVEEVTYMRKRVSAPTATDEDRHALGADLLHLASVLVARGEMAKARVAIEEDIGILRALHSSKPDNIRYTREISISLMWLSDALVWLGQFELAHQACDEIIATSVRLSAMERNTASFKSDLANGYLKLAALSNIEGKFTESAQAFEHARVIYHELAGAPGAALDLRANEGAALMGLADEYRQLADLRASRRYAEDAVALYRKLTAAEVTDVNSRQYLAEALYGLADTALAGKDFAVAEKSVAEGIAIDRALLKSFNSADVRLDLSSGQLLTGRLLKARGRAREALGPVRQSLEMRQRLAADQPGGSALSRAVAESMHTLVTLPGSTVSREEFAQYLRSMQTRGVFWPADQAWLDEAG
jgi:tetratricopeptide (TPR) repeat protein